LHSPKTEAAARLLTHARILLLADAHDWGGGRTDQQIGDALGVGICTIERVRQRFVEEGVEAALKPRPHPPHLGKLSGAVEARVLALTKTAPHVVTDAGRCGYWPTSLSNIAVALRLLQRLEFYYTPQHGSWLNMAEIELSVLAKQCLDRRLEEQRCVAEEVRAWETQRKEQEAKVRWRFTVSDARVKLKKIYPSIEN
jgi:transposase